MGIDSLAENNNEGAEAATKPKITISEEASRIMNESGMSILGGRSLLLRGDDACPFIDFVVDGNNVLIEFEASGKDGEILMTVREKDGRTSIHRFRHGHYVGEEKGE